MSPPGYDSSAKLQKPRVSRHGRNLHLSYECPHRLNVSKIYPVQSPRGAEVIVSGYSDGLHILWRGGRPLQVHSRSVTETRVEISGNSTVKTEWNQPVSIQKRSDKQDKPMVTEDVLPEDKPSFESEDDELDPDEPYPSFTQELRLSLGSPVLHLALPNVPQASALQSRVQVPLILEQRLVVVAACADGSLRLITMPLTPPSASTKSKGRLGAQICHLSPPTSASQIPRDVALTWTCKSTFGEPSDQLHVKPRDPLADTENLDLLVASSTSGHRETLNFYRVPITFDKWTGGSIPDIQYPFLTLPLSAASYSLHFSTSQYPSRQHARLLLVDVKGSLRVYDPFASDSKSRPSSRDSSSEPTSDTGAWVSSFSTPFQMPKSTTSNYPGLAQRRKILDAAWVSGSRAAIVLLDRGEWGVWDIDGAFHSQHRPTSMTDFVMQGFIGSADVPAPMESNSRSTQGLAPSTPHTRQLRQESLFGASKSTPVLAAPRGGVSAVSTPGAHGTIDDSVVLWYGNEAYYMPSLTSLWQRSLNSSGRDIGSLYGPGLSRIEGLDMSGELVNGVVQFPSRDSVASTGTLVQRDFAVTGEYRFVVVMATRPQTPAKSLFSRNTSDMSAVLDQQLLERGDLDLGGMDRLLNGMGTTDRPNGFAKKRVGFVG